MKVTSGVGRFSRDEKNGTGPKKDATGEQWFYFVDTTTFGSADHVYLQIIETVSSMRPRTQEKKE